MAMKVMKPIFYLYLLMSAWDASGEQSTVANPYAHLVPFFDEKKLPD